MPRIFVTGATGFIGSHFVNQAHERGYEIVALRRSPNSCPRIPYNKDPIWLEKSMTELSVSDFEGCEAVIHLAVHSANVPYDSLEACIEHNVLAPLSLFRVAKLAGISRIIVAGTCFEYGTAGERYDYIPVDAPLEPTASYPASKAAATSAFWTFAVEEDIELLFLRIFQVYGEGEPENRFWPTLRRKALAGEDMEMSPGLQIRDFISVAAVAATFVDAIDRKDLVVGQPVIENLGSGNPRSLRDFAVEQWDSFAATGKLIFGAVPMRKEEVMRYVPEL